MIFTTLQSVFELGQSCIHDSLRQPRWQVAVRVCLRCGFDFLRVVSGRIMSGVEVKDRMFESHHEVGEKYLYDVNKLNMQKVTQSAASLLSN